jgi:hypothetical protein
MPYAKNRRGRPSQVSKTGRRQSDLEREMSAERRRKIFTTRRAARFGMTAAATISGEGRLHRVDDPRAPLGTRQGLVLSRKTPHHGSRKHGSKYLATLRRYGEILNQREMNKPFGIAEQRLAAPHEFNAAAAVEASPFSESALEVALGSRPKREQLNKLPVAVPVRSFSSLFERVKDEGPETNLYLPWMVHGPSLQASRNRNRTRTSQSKGRPRSRSQPRRPSEE